MYKTGILIDKENKNILIQYYNNFEKKYEEKVYIDNELKSNEINIGEAFVFISNQKNEIIELFKIDEILN